MGNPTYDDATVSKETIEAVREALKLARKLARINKKGYYDRENGELVRSKAAAALALIDGSKDNG